MAGQGTARPQILVSRPPRADAAMNGHAAGSLHIQNVGQGSLAISAISKFYPTEFGKADFSQPTGAVDAANTQTLISTPLRDAVPLSSYDGTQMTFGVSDYGEIVPFQHPNGTEHVAVGGILEGYVVCYRDSAGDHIARAHYGTRNGIIPVSRSEIENSTTRTVVRVIARTADGKLDITHFCAFNKTARAVRVQVSLDNRSAETLAQVVYKRVSDWDVDSTSTINTFAFDPATSMTYAFKTHYVGVAGDRPPDFRDLDGWDDYDRRATDQDCPNGPAVMDGLTVLHYELGSLSPSATTGLEFAFAAGDSLADLRQSVRSVFGWLTVGDGILPGTLGAGAAMDIPLSYSGNGLNPGDYQAQLTVMSNDPFWPDDTQWVTFRVLDPTSPTAPGIPVPDVAPYTSRTTVVYTWTAAADPETGVKSYRLQVGAAPGAGNVFDGMTTGTTKAITGTDGQKLYSCVRAINGHDMNGAWSGVSTPTRIDIARPSQPATPQDGGAYTSNPLVTFTWTASTDGTSGSGVASYDVRVGTAPGATNLFSGNVGNVLTKAVAGPNGRRLYVRVRARDRAGNIGLWSGNSDGILIDVITPGTPGGPTDAGAYTSVTAVRFDWTAAADGGSTPSGVASYDLQVGATPGGSDVFNRNVGNVLARTVTGANGQTLFARVRALDGAGNAGQWSNDSDGITVDTVRPRLQNVVARNYMTLDVTFSESVRNHDVLSNYTCVGGLRLLSATRLTSQQSRLITTAQTPGTSYTLRVGGGVTDLAGNAMDATYRSRSFLGGLTESHSWELYR
jgi:hypothetical protein